MQESPRRPTILITGGAGFIGSNLIRVLLSETDARIVNLDALTYAGSNATLRDIGISDRHDFAHGRIEDAAQVRRLLWMHEPTAIIHLAAETHVDRSIDDARPFVDTNVVGTHVFLETVRDWWQQLPDARREAFRMLHVSTDEVYGSLPNGVDATESFPLNPSSPYSATKAASDHLAHAWHVTFGLPTIITRCANNYGPYQFPEKLIPTMIARARRGLELPVYGDGSQVRDWLHVDDHARALLAVLERGRVGEVYNIGSGDGISNLRVVQAICAELDRLAPAARPHAEAIRMVEDRPGHDQRYGVDCSKLRSELGWAAKAGFEEGIRRTVRWYLENECWSAEVLRSVEDLARRGTLTGSVVEERIAS